MKKRLGLLVLIMISYHASFGIEFIGSEAHKKLLEDVSQGVSTTVEKLGENIVSDALYIAAQYGQLEIIKKLCATRAEDLDKNDFSIALIYAAEAGHLEVVKYVLVEKAKDIDKNSLIRALTQAAERGHLPVVEFLLTRAEKLADISKEDFGKVLITAAGNGFLEVFKYLFTKKAEKREESIKDSFVIAVSKNHPDIVMYILEVTPKTIGKGDVLWALHTAGGEGKLPIIKLLLEHKELKEKLDKELITEILELAAKAGNDALVQYILETRAGDIQISTVNSWLGQVTVELIKKRLQEFLQKSPAK